MHYAEKKSNPENKEKIGFFPFSFFLFFQKTYFFKGGVMYAKNQKNHFFVFCGIHYVQPEHGKEKKVTKSVKNS
jgi:hypothetical protein